jgi:hypothetical protein
MRFSRFQRHDVFSRRDRADLFGDSTTLIGSVDPIQGVDHPRDVPKCILESRFLLASSSHGRGDSLSASDEGFRPPRILKR